MEERREEGSSSTKRSDHKIEGAYLFRPLDPTDLPSLRQLLERAVPGDYLLSMAEEWLSEGVVFGGFREGALVATVRLDDLGEGEGWYGGIRVDPALRRQGLAATLMNYSFPLAKNLGIRVARVLIEEENLPSQRLVATLGFREVLRVAHLAGKLKGAKDSSPPYLASTLPKGRAEEMSWVQAMGGYLSPTRPRRYCLVRASDERLRMEMAAGALYSLKDGGGHFLLSRPRKVTWSDKPLRAFTPLHGRLEALLDALSVLLEEEGSIVSGYLPVAETSLRLAAERGWIPGALWGRRIVLYDISLANAASKAYPYPRHEVAEI